MNIFRVSFKTKGGTWCSNIALAENESDVIAYYGNEYDAVSVSVGYDYHLKEAERKCKPVVKCSRAEN